mmetsp:Transcript_10246/g.26483  ORF Transcript_10246/g.26483 Transcript_10246/m.26483 type:complete len:205 (+) Transcript_10246:420-1034(+)
MCRHCSISRRYSGSSTHCAVRNGHALLRHQRCGFEPLPSVPARLYVRGWLGWRRFNSRRAFGSIQHGGGSPHAYAAAPLHAVHIIDSGGHCKHRHSLLFELVHERPGRHPADGKNTPSRGGGSFRAWYCEHARGDAACSPRIPGLGHHVRCRGIGCCQLPCDCASIEQRHAEWLGRSVVGLHLVSALSRCRLHVGRRAAFGYWR